MKNKDLCFTMKLLVTSKLFAKPSAEKEALPTST